MAARVRDALSSANIQSFMAHEDIPVSDEWRQRILVEIQRCDMFVCLLSSAYLGSAWCIQESGIAAIRQGMTIMPLSIDGTKPPGCISNIQSTKIDPSTVWLTNLVPGIANHDFPLAFKYMLKGLAQAKSFRSAEDEFKALFPFVERLTPEQAVQVLRVSIQNGQVLNANLCAKQYLPPIFRQYGHLLLATEYQQISEVLTRYVG